MTHSATPRSTYRLQLNPDFSFADAEAIVDYLKRLGVTDVYCSPILAARRGSQHGYDGVDPTQINPELGGLPGFERFSSALRNAGLGLLLDIVPNHMAVSPENRAWMDVLEHGTASAFARWFDIQWPAANCSDGGGDGGTGGLLLPVLGGELADVTASGELTLEAANGGFMLRYHDWTFPVEARSSQPIWQAAASSAKGESADVLAELSRRFGSVPDWCNADERQAAMRRHEVDDLKRAARKAIATVPGAREALACVLDEFNRASRAEGSPNPVLQLAQRQVYRLCCWRTARHKLTHRRFFDITDLIGVRVEDDYVFRATHKLIVRLVQQGRVTGLRIDHIDGLSDPAGYLQRLVHATSGSDGSQPYIIVEKILERDEPLDAAWPVCGTTGYDVLNALNSLFIDPAGLAALSEHQHALANSDQPFADLVRHLKAEMAEGRFAGEVELLLNLLDAALADPNIDTNQLRRCLIDLSARLPVYRTYSAGDHLTGRDRALVAACAGEVPDDAALASLRDILLNEGRQMTRIQRDARRAFILRWQQFTGPLMAKGLEDTALYRDARLISLNEVGADPATFDCLPTTVQFHDRMASLASQWPCTMTTTSTHDTKRSEDVRARINVLSEMAQQWVNISTQWLDINARWRRRIHGSAVPDSILEMFLYQSALGAWPLPGGDETAFLTRLAQYAIKAARERKVHTQWTDVDEAYEQALTAFINAAWDAESNAQFYREFQALQQELARYGAINSLSQTLLRLCLPGAADVYQGAELWDLSLVDPDNRRPVDFDLRRSMLEQVAAMPCSAATVRALLDAWPDGRIKLFLISTLLHCRRGRSELFLEGRYIPLKVAGSNVGGVCAFARAFEGQWALAAAVTRPRTLAGNCAHGEVILPAGVPSTWRDALTGAAHTSSESSLELRRIFADAPLTLLLAE